MQPRLDAPELAAELIELELPEEAMTADEIAAELVTRQLQGWRQIEDGDKNGEEVWSFEPSGECLGWVRVHAKLDASDRTAVKAEWRNGRARPALPPRIWSTAHANNSGRQHYQAMWDHMECDTILEAMDVVTKNARTVDR